MSRNKRKFDKLQEETLIAKKERLSRAGKYKRGMNLDITAEQEALLPVRTVKAIVVCHHPFCGLKGHTTTKAKKCKANPERLEREGTATACAAAVVAAAETAGVNAPQEDLEHHETVPFDDDSSLELYQEAGTWSEDEEGNAIVGGSSRII